MVFSYGFSLATQKKATTSGAHQRVEDRRIRRRLRRLQRLQQLKSAAPVAAGADGAGEVHHRGLHLAVPNDGEKVPKTHGNSMGKDGFVHVNTHETWKNGEKYMSILMTTMGEE